MIYTRITWTVADNMAESVERTRNELTLREKISVIQERETSGKSQRELAKIFNTGKTQIQSILKRKQEYLEAYEQNSCAGRKRPCSYASENDEINTLTWQWFCRMRTSAISISGPMIQAQALHYAKELGKDQFKASNGWLDSFKKRNSISQTIAHTETARATQINADSWTARLPSLVEGYAKRDIFNLVETALFYHALPDNTLTIRGEDCRGGRHSSERITVLLCANMEGEFVPPLVIGKSSQYQCFGNISDHALPVKWVSNEKAWLTVEIFVGWLKDFNSKMRSQNRHVILFLNSTPSHPQHVTMSNTKMVFLPPSIASCMPPLDQGVTHSFKLMYRKRLLRSILSFIDTDSPPGASDVQRYGTQLDTCDITELDACYWVRGACRDIKPETVTKCFLKAGFPGDEAAAEVVPEPDHQTELSELLSLTAAALLLSQPMDAQAYCRIDADVPSCEELDLGWEDALIEDLRAKRAKVVNCSTPEGDSEEGLPDELEVVEEEVGEEEVEGEEESHAPYCEIQSHFEALHLARQLWLYTMEHGSVDLADQFTAITDSLQRQFVAKIRSQQSIPDFSFTKND